MINMGDDNANLDPDTHDPLHMATNQWNLRNGEQAAYRGGSASLRVGKFNCLFK